MPEKDPANWQVILGLFTPEVKASCFAIFMAALRILYEDKEGKKFRKCLEITMCGALTYAITSGLTYFELPGGVSIFAGGMISLMGVDYVRERARKIFEKKIEAGDDFFTKK